jgi:hypothetical protein
VQKKRSIVFLISDFIDTGYDAALRIAGKKHDLVGLVLDDPRERDLPAAGLLELRDAETGSVRVIDSSDRRVRDSYRLHREDVQRSRKSLFLRSRLDAVDLRVDEPYLKPLSDFFRRREKRF